MGKLSNYGGSVTLISGLTPKNNGDFPLMEAHDVVVDESGTRLDEKLASLEQSLTASINEIDALIGGDS